MRGRLMEASGVIGAAWLITAAMLAAQMEFLRWLVFRLDEPAALGLLLLALAVYAVCVMAGLAFAVVRLSNHGGRP